MVRLKKETKKVAKLLFSSTSLAFSIIIMLGIVDSFGLNNLSPLGKIIVGVIGVFSLAWIGKNFKLI